MSHPLDRPVWSALTTRQAHLSLGDARAVRIAPEYGMFVAAADTSEDSLAAFARLMPETGGAVCMEAGDQPVPPGLVIARRASCHQMVATSVPAAEPDPEIVALEDDDAAAMLALATLTEPGPFFARTHRLGAFASVKREGRLVAMAGERLRPEGYTEVSGVCTHPDHRGHGYAGRLTRLVAERILARGETPFLHVYASNTSAIRLYETLGFRTRAIVTMTLFERA